jgi:hypothetical protein
MTLWSADDIRRLRELAADTRTASEIAGALGRTINAVYCKAAELDVPLISGKGGRPKGSRLHSGADEPVPSDEQDGRPKISDAADALFRAGLARHVRQKQAEQQRAGFGVVDGGGVAE